MVKSRSSLWLKSVRRIGKAQQTQGRRLLLSLVPKHTRASAVRRVKPVASGPSRLAKTARQSPERPAIAVPGLPWRWQKT